MKFFEVVLLVGNFVTLLLLAFPSLRSTNWPLVVASAVVIVSVVQVMVEGSRWQMLPGYALAGLLFTASLLAYALAHAMAGNLPGGRLLAGFALAIGAVVFVVSAIMPLAVPAFSFPIPTGSYKIGTLTYHWVDQARADFGDKTARRELMVQVWYPAAVPADAARDTYIQDDMHFESLKGGMPFPGFFFNHLKSIPTHAFRSVPMVAGTNRFPVLIFSPGAQGFRQHNTFEVEELVSRGYIVVGIDHPRAAREVVFPDGHRTEFDPTLIDVPRFATDPTFADGIFNYLAGDVSFTLDRLLDLNEADPDHVLTGRMDLDRTGMFGVSLGGLVAAEACRTDLRLRACLIQDVFVPDDVVRAGEKQPTMWLSRDGQSMRAEGWPESEVNLHQSTMRAAFEGTKTDGYLVQIPGMFHLNYTDFPYSIATPVARWFGMVGAIDWQRGHAIIRAYTVDFFDRYLLDKPGPLLDGPSSQFPEVHIESRHLSAAPAARGLVRG